MWTDGSKMVRSQTRTVGRWMKVTVDSFRMDQLGGQILTEHLVLQGEVPVVLRT